MDGAKPATTVRFHRGSGNVSLLRCMVRSAAVLAPLLFAVTPAAATNHDVAIHSPRLSGNSSNWQFNGGGRITGTELGKLIENEIGAENSQLVTIVINACSSGAGIGPISGQLKGPHNIITSCKGNELTAIGLDRKTGAIDGYLPSFFDSVTGDPDKSVDQHDQAGKTGEKRFPQTPQEEAAMKSKYEARRNLIIKLNKERTAKGQTPYQVPPPWDSGGREQTVQNPQNKQTADKPGSKKLASGTKSNHAIIFRTDDDPSGKTETGKKLADKARKALEAAGYTSIDELTPMTQAEQAAAAGSAAFPTIPSNRATFRNLQKALQTLKPKLDKDEHLTIVVISHGSIAQASSRTDADAGPGGGALFTTLASADHIGDQGSGNLLAEEAVSAFGTVLFDDYRRRRWDQPSLVIQTAEESNPSGLSVGVTVNGLALGELDLGIDPAQLGFHYLPFSDALIEQLVETTDFSAGFDIGFDFAGADDLFRLATQADIDALDGAFGFVGMSLLFNLDGDDAAIPEPPAALLFAAALLGLYAIRRRYTFAGNAATASSRLATSRAMKPKSSVSMVSLGKW